jgi:hypothetical protein
MVDLLGPGASGATPVLTTTTDVTAPTAGDTWFNDCPAGVADASATPILSKWLNWMLQQERQAIRFSGIPAANSYDNMMSWAMQSGYVNWASAGVGGGGAGFFSGTANALTASAPNAPIAVEGNTVVGGIVNTATNTGAMTFNWAGITPGAALVRNDGTACTGGEVLHNSYLVVRWDGGEWRICSPTPISFILPQLSQIDIQTFDASGTWNRAAGFPDSARVRIQAWGAGAGGEYADVAGGGAYVEYWCYLNELPSSVSVTVGAGGTGSIYPSSHGLDGGASTFNALNGAVSAPGGKANTSAGLGISSLLFPAGVGGAASPSIPTANSSVIFGGGSGADANHSIPAGTSLFGGSGGSSVGANGNVPGGGGAAGGNGTGNVSGAGGHGRVVVTTLAG